ncbi:MAG TPA: DUF5615 family PIN-like protein [Acidimicrobiales bacterium]|nr:DUF5615 family PIN-like protein [Acidimicrobiales bacterium]
MKLLLDQNLSRRLVDQLAPTLPCSAHVVHLGLDTASDEEIWTYAGQHDFVIVSKDSDFRQLAFLHGPPPKAIWLRVGNTSTAEIFNLLRSSTEPVIHFAQSADEALLVLPNIDG